VLSDERCGEVEDFPEGDKSGLSATVELPRVRDRTRGLANLANSSEHCIVTRGSTTVEDKATKEGEEVGEVAPGETCDCY